MADSSREYFRADPNLIGGMNGTITTGAPQWGSMKPGPPVAGSYYPCEWKVEEKKPASKQLMRGVGGISTVNLSTVDLKHVTQIPLTQTISHQNAWGGTGASGIYTMNTESLLDNFIIVFQWFKSTQAAYNGTANKRKTIKVFSLA